MIRIRRYRRSDGRAISTLISQTYSRFNAQEGTKQAVQEYVGAFNAEGKTTKSIQERFFRTPNFFIALDGPRPVGLVRGLENYLINLYVDGDYHRRGIGSRLLRKFEDACRITSQPEIIVRSSIYATPFYESMGYKKTTGVRNLHGLRVQPMKKKLKQSNPNNPLPTTRINRCA